ncbi:response regulator transcription factor [Shewanella sp. WXL01]|uniref:response regulator transcription factor n=1 Tax=Shewanella sp. WXL01 TaxID=2709721 RepID=UPI0014382E20|nr:response regulator transcription factor [Shewanella sp. WXL01]NKF52290.1 response regulator transcription factor [Shewanella sp. WXL01]
MLATNTRVLIVEDDQELNEQLSQLLTNQGYQVEQSYDGEAGLLKAVSKEFQLILLDVMLPVMDGLSMLKVLRKSCQTPVVMVTAKDAEQERIAGFCQGADDYVAKPFNTTELLLRIEAILRRSQTNQESNRDELCFGELKLNSKAHQVTVAGQALEFTPTQFKLLWELLANQGEVLSKAYLYQRVLNRSISAYDRSIDMHLSRVRRKLNEVDGPGDRLQTSHGKGYCFI